jgi:hypothetical protein
MALVRKIAGFLALSIGLGLAVVLLMALPPEQTPWGELALDQPVGPFTDMKLSLLNNRDANCKMLLEESEVLFTPIADESFENNCSFRNVVNLEQSVTPYSAPVRITCPGAAALYLWERDIVQPAAEFHFGQEVRRIEHYGTYSCRRVNGAATGRFSQHATANAIDIAGFRLADGTLVTVKDGWDGDESEAQFLREVRDGACRTFRGVLSPDYNAAHHDHFHLDMGPFGMCR